MSEGGPLDLSDADLSGFDALDSGRYNAEIFEVKWDAVKNASGTGAMPAGTPMLKVQVRILEPKINDVVIDQDRRAFASYVSPPKDYDKKNAAMMRGFLVRFFTSLGFSEEEVMGGGFDPDFDELKGMPCVVTLGKEQKKGSDGKVVEDEYNNPIKGFKPAGSVAAASGGGLL